MGSWRQLAPLPAARYQAAACWHDGKVYVFGGQAVGGAYQNTTFIYDPAGNTWGSGAPLPGSGRCYAFSTADDGVHVVFPSDGYHLAYDPTTDTWDTRTTAPGAPRRGALYFTDASGRFYLAGGSDTSRVDRYTPTTDSWAARAALTGPSASFAAVAAGVLGSDGKIYIGPAAQYLRIYNPTTDTWANTTDAPLPYVQGNLPIAQLPSGQIITLPRVQQIGLTGGGMNPRIDGYDVATGAWSMGVIPNYPGGSIYEAAVATQPGGVVYLLGGVVEGGTPTATVWSYKQNDPPLVATLLTMTGGAIVSTAAVNRARHGFSDPNAGDSQSKADHRWRKVSDTTWITETVISPNPWRDFPAGSLTPGDYERQVLVYDAVGEPASAWTPSGLFTAVDPPDGPTITYPINGQLLDQVEYVEWSVPAQDAYRVRRLPDDGAGNPDTTATPYFDTGEVTDTLTRKIPLTFAVNGRTEHVQVQIKDGGVWSDWDSVVGDVSYTRPPTPTYTVYPDPATGSLLLMIATPDPEPGDPAAVAVDVFIDDGAGLERKAVDLSPTTSWRYWTPISGRDYTGSIMVQSRAANGTTASST